MIHPLDNRPSNHTLVVDDAIGTTVRIRATKGWPQNKAHVEGSFEGKHTATSVPPGADGGRYLLGIAKNIAHQDEGIQISKALLRERLAARDLALADLHRQRDETLRAIADPAACTNAALDRAADAHRQIDRLLWLHTAADLVLAQPLDQHHDLYRRAARRIYAAYAVAYTDRLAAVRVLARRIFPLN